MIRHLIAACLALLFVSQDSSAQSREYIGYGRLLTNDFLALDDDRWRTGSFNSSRIWGYGWDGELPQQPGDILELRLGAQIIAPDSLVKRAPGDRPYAGVITAGLHTHFMRWGTDFAMGADLVAIGPQTRLDRLQKAFHDAIGIRAPSKRIRANQIDDAFYLDVVVEAARDIALSDVVTMRPFVELRSGVETMARVGVDMTIGDLANGGLRVRDTVSGQRYTAIRTNERGFAFLLGADVATVAASEYFPASYGVAVSDTRYRFRGGIQWQTNPATIFYGVTYLGEEFEGQDEGQFVGSIRVDLHF